MAMNWRTQLRYWLSELKDDRRGTSMVTTAVTLPLLIILFLGIFGLFRMMAGKWVFDRGVREAARYVSEEGRYWDLQPSASLPANYYEIEARRIILSRLRDVFSYSQVYDVLTHTLQVSVTEPILAESPNAPPGQQYPVQEGDIDKLCSFWRAYNETKPGEFRHHQNVRFMIYASMDVPFGWMPRLPFSDPITPTLTFKNRAIGYVQCPRWSGIAEPSGPPKPWRYGREGPAIPFRNMATPWFPTVTPVPTSTPAPSNTPAPTSTP